MIKIVEKASPKDFFKAGVIANKDYPLYVSLFDQDLKRFLSQDNPLFSKFGEGTFFTAYLDGKPVGRVVAHIHTKSNEKFGLKRGYFGYFDCIDNNAVASELLKAVESYHQSKGMIEVHGNFNLTAMQQVGVMTEGFETAPYTDQVYNAPHIPRLLETCGYAKYFPMSTFELDLTKFDPSSLKSVKVEKVLSDNKYNFLNIKKKDFSTHMESVRAVLNDGFANNPMFVPLTQEEFHFQAKDMMWIIDEKISSLVEFEGEPVGTVVCIPDLNPFLKATGSKLSIKTPLAFLKHKMNRDRAVIIFYSVAHKMHGQGINPAMLYKVTTALKERGYNSLGITWIADENISSLRQMEKIGAKKMHQLYLYKKDIQDA